MINQKITAIIPALNESVGIQQVVQELCAFTDVVVVIDDGSNDTTGITAQYQGAVVLRHERTRGYGAALKTGIDYAMTIQSDMVIFADGDGAHDPSSIPGLVRQHMNSGADLTLGSRLLETTQNNLPSSKKAVNRLAAAIFRQATGVGLSDVACGMRVLSQNAMRLSVKDNDFGYSFQFLMEAIAQNLKIAEAPVKVRYDASEPLVSRNCEIIAFLSALRSQNAARRFQGQIDSLADAVTNFHLTTVAVEDSYYYLHPICALEAFLVQEQHQDFYSRDFAHGAVISF